MTTTLPVILAVALLFLLAEGVDGQGGYCGDGAAVNATYFASLVSAVKITNSEISRQQILLDAVNGSSLGFNSDQIVTLLSLFTNNLLKTSVVGSLSPLILGLKTQNVKT